MQTRIDAVNSVTHEETEGRGIFRGGTKRGTEPESDPVTQLSMFELKSPMTDSKHILMNVSAMEFKDNNLISRCVNSVKKKKKKHSPVTLLLYNNLWFKHR